MIGATPSCHAGEDGGVFPEDPKPPSLNICHGVDCPDTCETESHMENSVFTRACLSDIKVIIEIMRVLLGELLCQAAMRRIPTLEYLLSGPVVPDNKYCRFH
jgi:hypothetical protein